MSGTHFHERCEARRRDHGSRLDLTPHARLYGVGVLPMRTRIYLACLLGIAGTLPAAIVTAPANALSGDLNAGNRFPFDPSYPFSSSSMRYQQGYSSGFFTSVTTDSVWITGMRFRGDAGIGATGETSGPFSGVISDIKIELSTTSRSADSLLSTFAQNVGSDATVVYPRGSLALFSSDIDDGTGARLFDIIITFPTPFHYNPLLGNLLLDVTNYSGDRLTAVNWIAFDAADSSGDGISRVWASSSGATTGTVQSLGLVTQFVTSTVPELSMAAMLGLAVFAGVARRRR